MCCPAWRICISGSGPRRVAPVGHGTDDHDRRAQVRARRGAEITLPDGGTCRVRLVDCVGYLVDGALGSMEDDSPRMVSTPWQEEPMTLAEAAETGTHKVIGEHSTIGLVVTTDGTFTDIPRENYVPAEKTRD